MAFPIADARLRFVARRVHALGVRPLYELLCKVLRSDLAGADLCARLERYARLDPQTVSTLGADKLPPTARLVGGKPL